MLKQLIRRRLAALQMSMRHASLAADMNEAWLKHFLAAKKPMDPGIGAMVRLASVLRIDDTGLLEAVKADARGGRHDQQSREEALRIVSEMTPQERAAFLASRRRRHQQQT